MEEKCAQAGLGHGGIGRHQRRPGCDGGLDAAGPHLRQQRPHFADFSPPAPSTQQRRVHRSVYLHEGHCEGSSEPLASLPAAPASRRPRRFCPTRMTAMGTPKHLPARNNDGSTHESYSRIGLASLPAAPASRRPHRSAPTRKTAMRTPKCLCALSTTFRGLWSLQCGPACDSRAPRVDVMPEF